MGPDLTPPLIGGSLALPPDPGPPSPPSAADLEVPLLAAQTAIWADARALANKPAYTLAQSLTIAGPVEHEALTAAVRRAADECDTLRLRLRLDRAAALPDVGPPEFATLPLIDLSDESDPDAAGRFWAEAEFRRPFRLDGFPLCRFALLRLGPERHVWFMAFHQLVMDPIGANRFAARVADLYSADRQGRGCASMSSPTLAQARAAEDDYLASHRAARDRAYWLARLSALPDPLVDASPGLSERTRSGRAARSFFTLPAPRAEPLRAAATSLGVSLPRLLTAIAAIAFSRWYDCPDLMLGLALSQRTGLLRHDAIGPFSQILPLRLAVDRSRTLAETARAVARAVAQDQRHRQFPIHELRAPLGLLHQGRLFADISVSYLRAGDCRDFGNAPSRTDNISFGFGSPWQVTWLDAGPGAGLDTIIDHDPGLIPAFEGEQVAEALRCLLEAAPDSTHEPVATLPMMRDRTRDELLQWSDGETVPVPTATLASLFGEQTHRTPATQALVWNDERLTYADLHTRAVRLARRLAAAGIRRGAVVGLALPRDPTQLVSILAVHMAGGAYMPLDPSFPADRLGFMVGDARAGLVLTTAAIAATLPTLPCKLARLDVEADLPPPFPGQLDAPTPNDLAYVLYTSGSTGRPKGVGVEHISVVNFVYWIRSIVDDTDLSGILFSTVLGFDISVIEIFLPLSFGGRIVMVDNILALPAAPARAEVRMISTVPSLLEALLRINGLPPHLRTMVLGGEALNRVLADRLLAEAPDLNVYNLYGPTEATVYASAAPVHPGETGPPPLGRPIWNSSLYVLDADGQLLPPGAAGELWIAGVQVARGYLSRPDLTESRFKPDHFRPGEVPGRRMYRTGDRARWRPDRQLDFLGRLDDQIKINGVRIELGEIETALRTLPGVAAAAVVLRADEGGPRGLVGWLVASEASGDLTGVLDSAALRLALRTRLPEMLIPAAFVWVDALPLTSNGKLDRRALQTLPLSMPAPRTAAVAIRTPVELAVAELWEQVLQTTEITADDDFFELGGDSLAAVNLLSQVEMRFKIHLTTDVLAGGLTVARLARLIEHGDSAELPGFAVPLQSLGVGTPFHCVPGIGGDPTHLRALARSMGTDRPFLALRGGLLPVGGSPDRIEDVATRYVEALLANQQGRPILIGGYSLGATVAYEMAQQLTRRGHRVALLALIDTRPPDWRLTVGNAPATLRHFLGNLPNWVREDLLPGGLSAFARNLRRHLLGIGQPTNLLDRVLDVTGYTAQQRATMERYHRALNSYRPQPYAGRVVVLRARTQPVLWAFDDPTLGWQRLVQHAIDLRLLPGNHATIMSEPLVSRLAEELRACISRAEDDAETVGRRTR